MKFRIIFFCCLLQNVNQAQKNIDALVQKINEIQAIKIKMQQDAMHHHEQLFANIHQYGQAAKQVANSAILIANCVQKKEKAAINNSNLSLGDCSNIVQAVMAGFVLMVEVARMFHARSLHKKFVHTLTHQDFVIIFPHLAIVEYQILLMKTLIQLSSNGTLPEQVFARIALAKMSLPYPFTKFANKAAKKIYKKSFDKNGNFILTQWPEKKDPYKKFSKKVIQDWKDIALCASSFSQTIQPNYESLVAPMIDTNYNNALIIMIYAGMQQDFQTVVKIQQQFKDDDLVQKLFEWYEHELEVNGVTKI